MKKEEKSLIERFINENSISKNEGLDLGCGPSVKDPKNCDGQEFADKLLGVDLNPNFKPDVCGDIRNLDALFQNKTFRFILLSHTLEDMENPYDMIRQMFKHIGPDGVIAILCPYRGIYPRAGTINSNPGHRYDFDPHDVEHIVELVNDRQFGFLLEVLSKDTLHNNWSFEYIFRVVKEDV